MVRCLDDREIAKLTYEPNALATNKYSKYFIGGAVGLYLFVYKPNKQGVSLKKYKIKRKSEGKDVVYPLLSDSGKDLLYPSTSPSEARSIALAIQAGLQENRAAKDGGLFSYYADELFKMDEKTLSKVTIDKKRIRFDRFIAPYLNKEPVKSITTPAIIKVIRNAYDESRRTSNKPNATGYETANRVKIINKADYGLSCV